MIFKNHSHTYGWVNISIHWLMALMAFGLFGVGFYMDTLSYYDPLYKTLPYFHKSFGIIFAGLLVFRFTWRRVSAPPAPIAHNVWEVKAAHAVHYLLYLLMLMVVISGYLISTADGRPISVFGMIDVPATLTYEGQEDLAGDVHEFVTYTFIGLACLHALAAIKHRVIDKDQTLTRMLRPLPGGDTNNAPIK
jgi:cytochrome b561